MHEPSETHPLAVPAATLKALGWGSFRARKLDDPDVLIPLLEELRSEPCIHTWRHHLPASGPIRASHCQVLFDTENRLRPTVFFVYEAETLDGQEIVAAAGTVSERIEADFPFEGFPVAARCYIRPSFRRHGLYRHILNHRLIHCLTRWGTSLKAVHLGSANPQVWEAVALHGGFPMSFVHVGDEDLEVCGQVHRVPALLAFHPKFQQAVLEAGQGNGFSVEFREMLARVVGGHGDGSSWGRLRRLAEAEHSTGSTHYPRELEELFALGDAIPLKR